MKIILLVFSLSLYASYEKEMQDELNELNVLLEDLPHIAIPEKEERISKEQDIQVTEMFDQYGKIKASKPAIREKKKSENLTSNQKLKRSR